jgi:hypothetical protein
MKDVECIADNLGLLDWLRPVPRRTIKRRHKRKADGRKEMYKLMGIVLVVGLAILLAMILSLHVD